MLDVKQTLNEAEERFEETVMYLEDALARIRAGKANIKLLDNIRVGKGFVLSAIRARAAAAKAAAEAAKK